MYYMFPEPSEKQGLESWDYKCQEHKYNFKWGKNESLCGKTQDAVSVYIGCSAILFQAYDPQ